MDAYNQPISDVLKSLETSPEGLTHAQITERLEKFGLNELQEKKKNPPWMIFLSQFKDFMILVLAAAAIISGVIGDTTDTIIIFIIIILNAIVGFIQEFRAEKALEALKKMTVTQTHVIRDGQSQIISASELVPGDLVVMEAGNVVPADIRLLEAHAFRIDESSLTGESLPVDKISGELGEEALRSAETLGEEAP